MAHRYSLTLPLPPGYRPADILAFHRRDPLQLAEQAGESCLKKGIVWQGIPACLSVQFSPGQAEAHLDLDGDPKDDEAQDFAALVRRMLGLTQEVEAFEQRHGEHPQLDQLIARQRGLRVPAAASPFEALSWAITGQQISVHAAVSLRRKLILVADLRHSSGLLCYPEAPQVLALPEEALRQAGFSRTKASTLHTLARQVCGGDLPLEAWTRDFPGADILRQQLLAVRGIGPWTVDYALLRGFGWLDGSLHGDAAVRRGLQTLLGAPDKVDEHAARTWLTQFSPWRALACAHIWAAQSSLSSRREPER